MGVPVITLAGNTHASRVGMSLLENIDVSNLVAKSSEEYVRIAVNLAKDLNTLKLLRGDLRNMISNSSLMDSKRFIIAIENSYREIWENWCTRNERQGK
jgi:predicted O-linked N-acetylglucosamine transferase (SPINDLY family)